MPVKSGCSGVYEGVELLGFVCLKLKSTGRDTRSQRKRASTRFVGKSKGSRKQNGMKAHLPIYIVI